MQLPSGGFVSAVCSCNGALNFATFDEENEQVRVPCMSCGQVWLMKRTDKGWTKLPLSETLKDRRERGGK
jgi:hypothetical protein